MKTHELKTWPQYFEQVVAGQKQFEIRKNDRDFQVGDVLVLDEYCPDRKVYTGNYAIVKIEYILHGGQFGIEPGYCVMSITLIPQP